MFFGKQKVNRERGRGLCYQGQHRGLSKGITGHRSMRILTMTSLAGAFLLAPLWAHASTVEVTYAGSTYTLADPDGSGWDTSFQDEPWWGDSDLAQGVAQAVLDTGQASDLNSNGNFFAWAFKDNLVSVWIAGTDSTAASTSLPSTLGNINYIIATNVVGSGDTGGSDALNPVPLPASILFLGAAIGGLGLMGRRRRSAA